MESLAMVSFHAQLREGTGEGCVNRCDFFRGEFLLQPVRRSLTSFFCDSLINLLRGDCHVRRNRYMIICNLNQAFSNRKELIMAITANDHFSGGKKRYQPDML